MTNPSAPLPASSTAPASDVPAPAYPVVAHEDCTVPAQYSTVRPAAVSTARPRLDSIDLLRGLVMFVMVLDHVRHYFGASAMNPRDVTDPALFLTRWVTHYCAPNFIFLAGVSAYLFGHRGRSKGEISRFLLTRGLWLVFLEATVLRFAWSFDWRQEYFVLQVIWAIGCGMIALAGLVYLPRWAIGLFGASLIVGHNLLDSLHAAQFGSAGWLWNILHEPALLEPITGVHTFFLYPLIPWVGVIAAGYAFGPVFTYAPALRVNRLLQWGIAALTAFFLLRGMNLYGDPAPRVSYDNPLSSLLSFVNCEKYPPSLLYLTMTIGPALILLAIAERFRGKVASWLITLGRVPMFYYVAHIFLIHAAALVYVWATGGDIEWLVRRTPTIIKPAGFGLSLPGVYAIWLGVVVTLYPLCHWFAGLKQRRKDWWLSYL